MLERSHLPQPLLISLYIVDFSKYLLLRRTNRRYSYYIGTTMLIRVFHDMTLQARAACDILVQRFGLKCAAAKLRNVTFYGMICRMHACRITLLNYWHMANGIQDSKWH